MAVLPGNKLLLKPAVCADANLFAAACGRPAPTNSGFASVLLQRDRRQSLVLLTESHLLSVTTATVAPGLRSELICWPSGCKRSQRFPLLKWDLPTPRNSLRPHYDAILVLGCQRKSRVITWSSIQGCDALLGICWCRQYLGIWWDSLPMSVTVSLM